MDSAFFNKREIVVDGVKVPIRTSDFAITDIDQAQRTSTEMIAFWASVAGSAEKEAEQADALYRQWRANATNKVLDKDPKTSEWRVKAVVEAHPDFLKLKNALAQAADNLATAKGLMEAAIRRANLAQSVGANVREATRKLGTGVTRERVASDEETVSDSITGAKKDSDESEADKRKRLREALKTKRKPPADSEDKE